MNGIDVIVLAWLVFSVIRGYRIGLIRQVASFAGFLLGVFSGGWAASVLLQANQDSGTRLMISLALILAFGLIIAHLAERFAAKLQRKMQFDMAQTLNAISGAAFGVVAAFIVAWLLLSSLNRLPLAETGLSISESRSYRVMRSIMPSAPAILGRLTQAITPYGFPQIFVGGEPQTAPTAQPAHEDVETAAAKARQAVVRVEGQACSAISAGSGFVAAPGFVATNAHVIAGVDTPVVVRGDEKFRAVPVWFNDKLDFAVLRVSGLERPVLSLASSAPERGQSGAVLGYPNGGPLTVVPGVMQARYEAVGRDIYSQRLVTRSIYEVQASIQRGNSGGPFVLPNGTVAGMMFGAPTEAIGVTSYAISSAEMNDELDQAIGKNSPVATGSCLETRD